VGDRPVAIDKHKITKILFQTGNNEVSPTEPLDNVKEHIANILTELPSHFEKDEKIAFHHRVLLWKGKAVWL